MSDSYFDLDPMEWVVAALANAVTENLSLQDVYEAAKLADSPEAFDDAVNMVILSHPEQEHVEDLFNGDWAAI